MLRAKEEVFGELSANREVREFVLSGSDKFTCLLMEDLYRKIKQAEQNMQQISVGTKKLQLKASFMHEKLNNKEN